MHDSWHDERPKVIKTRPQLLLPAWLVVVGDPRVGRLCARARRGWTRWLGPIFGGGVGDQLFGGAVDFSCAAEEVGEVAVARAAANGGTAVGLSSFGSKLVEEVAAANPKTFFPDVLGRRPRRDGGAGGARPRGRHGGADSHPGLDVCQRPGTGAARRSRSG